MTRLLLAGAISMMISIFGTKALINWLTSHQIGQPILESLGKADSMEAFNERFNDFGFWAVLVAGLTPFPYKVITIMSGWTGLPFWTFMVTSIIARGGRFFLVAGLLYKYGEPIRYFIEKRLGLVTIVFCVLLFGAFYLVKFL